MGINLSPYIDSLIKICGGALILILGFVFYQLMFLQKSEIGALSSSKSFIKVPREKPTKREKEGTVKHEPVGMGKPETERPGRQPMQEQVKPPTEKMEKQNSGRRLKFIDNLLKRMTRKEVKAASDGASVLAPSRMPKLSSLGIKDGKPNSEKSDAQAKAMVKDMNSTPTNLAGSDVISAMAAVASHGTTITVPSEAVVPSGQEIIPPVPPPPIIPAPVAPPELKPPPVPEIPKEEKKEEKSDRMKDMFGSDDDEEAESNKVAKNLEQVDIQDLLTESQTLINSFMRRGK
jgi:hypothetical protein